MPECPSDGLGDDFATLPDVAVLQAVTNALNCRFSLHVFCEARPLLGAVRAEMNRSVCDRVYIVGDTPGVLVGTVGFTEGRSGVGKTDVFRG